MNIERKQINFAGHLILPALFFILATTAIPAVAQDWVHPNNRQNYAGYEKFREQKRNGKIWTYATNRPLGNTRGGGTTSYWDYKPNYRPEPQRLRKKYKRPKRTGNNSQDSCNCGN